jgi:hypothetical protein
MNTKEEENIAGPPRNVKIKISRKLLCQIVILKGLIIC